MADTYNNLDPTFFPGRAATVYYRAPPSSPAFDAPKPTNPTPSLATTVKREIQSALNTSITSDVEIGVLGILHPSVLEKFEISYPCSALEITLEPFRQEMHGIWTDL